MIYVTHDQVEAMTLADRIVVLNGGVIEQVGTPMELYQRPRNLFVAGFIGSPKMNFLPGVVVRQGKGFAVDLRDFRFPVSAAGKVGEGQRVTLGFRPEDVSPSKDGRHPICRASPVVREQLGRETLVYFRGSLSDELLIAEMPGHCELGGEGETALHAAPSGAHLFDEYGNRIE
jgi:multiple sugar transport system ATP-binding protein